MLRKCLAFFMAMLMLFAPLTSRCRAESSSGPKEDLEQHAGAPSSLTQDDVDLLNAMEIEWGANIDKAVPYIRQKNYQAASAYLTKAMNVISGIKEIMIKKGYNPGVNDRLIAMELLTGAYIDMAKIGGYAGNPKTIGNNIQAIRALFEDARQKLTEAKVKFHEVPQLQELCRQFLGTLDDFEREVKALFSPYPLSKPKS